MRRASFRRKPKQAQQKRNSCPIKLRQFAAALSLQLCFGFLLLLLGSNEALDCQPPALAVAEQRRRSRLEEARQPACPFLSRSHPATRFDARSDRKLRALTRQAGGKGAFDRRVRANIADL